MGLFEAFVVYVVLWWVVLFTILPLKVKPLDKPQKGHAESAPAHPRLGFKFLLTSAIAFVLWLAVYFAIAAEIYSFHE